MVKKYAIRWTQIASDDLKSIFGYLCDADCKRQAYYVVSEIKKQAQGVLIFPWSYPIEPKTENSYIRFTVKWRYKIIFKIDKNTVYIVRIFHASQDPDDLTFAPCL
jgi:plasmid stabilization system protein ParE